MNPSTGPRWQASSEGDDLNRFFEIEAHAAWRSVVVAGRAGKPSMVVMPNGQIVLSYIHGYDMTGRSRERMEVVRSADGGRTWSQPVQATDSPYNDREGYLVLLPDGELLLCYIRVFVDDDRRHPYRGPYIIRSQDGGRSWSSPQLVDISAVCPAGPYGCGDRGHVVLPDGTLLLFVGVYDPAEQAKEYMLVSRDAGRSFEEFHLVSDASSDSSFCRLESGKLLGFLRIGSEEQLRHPERAVPSPKGEALNFMALNESVDGGKTWNPPRRVTNNNEIPGHILPLSDRRVLVTFGVRHHPLGIQAMLSDDEGHSWGPRLMLAWHGGEFASPKGHHRHTIGHPYSVQLPGGEVMTAYYRLADPFDCTTCQVEAIFWDPPAA